MKACRVRHEVVDGGSSTVSFPPSCFFFIGHWQDQAVLSYFVLVAAGGGSQYGWCHMINGCGQCCVHPQRWRVTHILVLPLAHLPQRLMLGERTGEYLYYITCFGQNSYSSTQFCSKIGIGLVGNGEVRVEIYLWFPSQASQTLHMNCFLKLQWSSTYPQPNIAVLWTRPAAKRLNVVPKWGVTW